MFDILDMDSLTKLYMYWYVYIENWTCIYECVFPLLEILNRAISNQSNYLLDSTKIVNHSEWIVQFETWYN